VLGTFNWALTSGQLALGASAPAVLGSSAGPGLQEGTRWRAVGLLSSAVGLLSSAVGLLVLTCSDRSVGGVGVSGSRDVEGSVCHTPAAGGGGAAM